MVLGSYMWGIYSYKWGIATNGVMASQAEAILITAFADTSIISFFMCICHCFSIFEVPFLPFTPSAVTGDNRHNMKYTYKVKIINSQKKSDFIVLTWHQMTEKFQTPSELKERLIKSFSDRVPSHQDFHIGYFEGKASAKYLHIWCVLFTCLINSLGPKFSSQGHFQSLQLLNVPQFLFSRLVRLKISAMLSRYVTLTTPTN